MPAIQNFTADRMSLVTPPNSNGWTIPLNETGGLINSVKKATRTVTVEEDRETALASI